MYSCVVSGGAGFIGSHLCEHLLEKGWSVIVIDNLITGSKNNVQHLLSNPGFTFFEADICLEETLQLVQSKVDYVFHLASIASPIHYAQNPIETLNSGSTGTRNMLELAKNHNARFLLASTSEVYGDPKVNPQTENYWGNVNPIGERSCYDESKRYAEALTMAYHRTYKVHTHIARIFNTFGPRMQFNDGRVIPAFIGQALNNTNISLFGDGTQTRSFCFVTDLVDGLLRLIQSEEHLPINLGNPNAEYTIRHLAEMVIDLTKSKSKIEFFPLPPDDPKLRCPNITKATELLKWHPTTSMEEGLKRTIQFHLSANKHGGLFQGEIF